MSHDMKRESGSRGPIRKNRRSRGRGLGESASLLRRLRRDEARRLQRFSTLFNGIQGYSMLNFGKIFEVADVASLICRIRLLAAPSHGREIIFTTCKGRRASSSNGFPSPPRVSFPKGDERFALRGRRGLQKRCGVCTKVSCQASLHAASGALRARSGWLKLYS